MSAGTRSLLRRTLDPEEKQRGQVEKVSAWRDRRPPPSAIWVWRQLLLCLLPWLSQPGQPGSPEARHFLQGSGRARDRHVLPGWGGDTGCGAAAEANAGAGRDLVTSSAE